MNLTKPTKSRCLVAITAGVFLAGFATTADAHPGHGPKSLEESVLHLLQPEHFGVIAAGVAIGYGLVVLIKRCSRRSATSK